MRRLKGEIHMPDNFTKLRDRELAGLDIRGGVRIFGGNEKAYLRILTAYAKETKSCLKYMESVSQDNLSDYRIKVHGLKGTSAAISAMKVSEEAKKLEAAAETGDFAYITTNNQAFIDSTLTFIDSIENMLDEINNETSKPKKSKPNPGTLKQLLVSCKEYDVGGVDKAIEELEKYDYESGNELVAGLRENVNFMQFGEIIEKLSSD